MNQEQVTQLVESLDLEEGDLVSSALVLANVSNVSGDTSVLLGATADASWVEQLGLVRAAELALYRMNQEGDGGEG